MAHACRTTPELELSCTWCSRPMTSLALTFSNQAQTPLHSSQPLRQTCSGTPYSPALLAARPLRGMPAARHMLCLPHAVSVTCCVCHSRCVAAPALGTTAEGGRCPACMHGRAGRAGPVGHVERRGLRVISAVSTRRVTSAVSTRRVYHVEGWQVAAVPMSGERLFVCPLRIKRAEPRAQQRRVTTVGFISLCLADLAHVASA